MHWSVYAELYLSIAPARDAGRPWHGLYHTPKEKEPRELHLEAPSADEARVAIERLRGLP